jgi:hypothetical protein
MKNVGPAALSPTSAETFSTGEDPDARLAGITSLTATGVV